MLNIIRIFASDAKRLWTNVVAVVVIIGLSVIPSLYAWFNIISNWAPYDASATGRLQVAVASEDEGIDLGDATLNIGGIVIDNLKQNKSINWKFPKSADKAVDGVTSGKYYAALVIDEHFSEDMLSFIGSSTKHPEIHYYENEKKNAIAPKITGKVKTTVQQEVNSAFVSTLAQGALTASKYISTSGDEHMSLTGSALSHMQSLDRDLDTCTTILDSYISMIDSTQSLMDASAQVSKEMQQMIDAADSMSASAQSAANTAESSLGTASDMVIVTLNDVERQLDALQVGLTDAISAAGGAAKLTVPQIDGMIRMAEGLQAQTNQAVGWIRDLAPQLEPEFSAVDDSYDQLLADLYAFRDAGNQQKTDIDSIADRLNGDIDTTNSNTKKLFDRYMDTVKPEFSSTMDTVKSSLLEVQDLVGNSSQSISDVAAILGSYPDMLSLGRQELVDSRAQIAEMQDKLSELIGEMQHMEGNAQYAMLEKLIQTDPKIIAEFISDPVNIEIDAVYGISTNGSATAPFYIVLSIWVGALILVAIIHTQVKDRSRFMKLRTWQEYFGRYLVFYIIGQIQTAITVFGALLYIGIQCPHPFLFWLACSITSFVFTLLMYSLAYAFGAIGEAAAVVLMVIQVAGSGGTFPVEVLPEVYQVLYRYMPFAYSMNAIRECIGGMHGSDYWQYLLCLGSYVAASLVMGLIISIPCRKLNRRIDLMKEEIDIMA